MFRYRLKRGKETNKKRTFILSGNSRTQLIFAVAVLLKNYPNLNNDTVILFHNQINGHSAFMAGFESFFKKLPVELCITQKINFDLFDKKTCVIIIASSQFPWKLYFKTRLCTNKISILRTEEGIGSYANFKQKMKGLRDAGFSELQFRVALGSLIFNIASFFKITQKDFLFDKNNQINQSLKGYLKLLIKELSKNLDTVHSVDLLGLPIFNSDVEIIETFFQGKIAHKLHPRFRKDDFLNLKNVIVSHYTVEELIFRSDIKCLVGFNSSALLYAAVLPDIKTINLNIRPEESDTTIEALMTKYVSEIITEP